MNVNIHSKTSECLLVCSLNDDDFDYFHCQVVSRPEYVFGAVYTYLNDE